jgi:pantoate kinase
VTDTPVDGDADAVAHAPGSVTLLFAPAGTDGSRGVSVTTADGVRARLRPAAETLITLDGERTDFEPVAGVLERLGVTARVDLVAETPVGAGFGASGAATLATALAANAACALDCDRDGLVAAAHRAEVAAGTGLGDVFVQARGGLVYDAGDGRGRRSLTAGSVADGPTVEYVSHGGIPTASVLDDEATLDRIRAAAGDAFDAFDPDTSVAELFELGWGFATETGLVTDRVRETVDRVETAGGTATMAMVGETVLAAGTDGVLPGGTRLTDRGARLVDA